MPDAATFAAHGAGFDTVEAWRRHNVDTFVRTVSERIKAAKPWVKFGISPFGIWRNRTTDPLGSDTGGSQSYDLQFADTRRWVLEGWLDYINPQIYWQFGLAVADYAKLVPWWADVAAASSHFTRTPPDSRTASASRGVRASVAGSHGIAGTIAGRP